MNAYCTLYFFCFGIKWDWAYTFQDFAHVSQQVRIDLMMQSATPDDYGFDFDDLYF